MVLIDSLMIMYSSVIGGIGLTTLLIFVNNIVSTYYLFNFVYFFAFVCFALLFCFLWRFVFRFLPPNFLFLKEKTSV